MARPTCSALFCLASAGVLFAACGGGEDRQFGGVDGGAAADGGTGGGGSGATGGTTASGGTGGKGGSSAGSGGGGSGGQGTGGTAASGGAGGAGGSGGTGGACCTIPSDTDCQCIDCRIVAKDVDGDGEGSIDCAEAPGRDCDDGDRNFVQNTCGGCTQVTGGEGSACGTCGVYGCVNSDITCVTPTPAPAPRCTGTRIETCLNGQWALNQTCTGTTPACLTGRCVECDPNTYKCEPVGSESTLYKCNTSGAWIYVQTCASSLQQFCNATYGTCSLGIELWDQFFEVPGLPQARPRVPEDASGLPTEHVLDLAGEFRFT